MDGVHRLVNPKVLSKTLGKNAKKEDPRYPRSPV
jgi:hypothetical protein